MSVLAGTDVVIEQMVELLRDLVDAARRSSPHGWPQHRTLRPKHRWRISRRPTAT